MDTRQLAAFCAVVERRSFSQAAERLGVTQPAVSLQIQALEKRLGTKLLDRSGRRVEPTEAGMRLYRGAQRLLALEEQVVAEVVEESSEELDGRFELGAWLAKESVRDVYLADTVTDAATLLDKAIAGCATDDVAEVRSLGKTLASWRSEILAHHDTGASNGPTEGLNLCVKKVKRCGHGFRTFEHYRLRVLLHAGGVTWPTRPKPPRIRTRAPHSVA